MSRLKFNTGLLIFILVVLIFGISLVFRIVFPFDKVFVGGDVKFASNDVYFYTRLIDNLAHNFPDLTSFDPYLIFPGGGDVGSIPIFHWMIALIAWIFGAGSPTQHLVDLMEAYLPAITGALAVIPAFFLGKALFNRWAGVLAAGLVAIFPGEFLTRTSLAAGDTPVAEVFFTTTAMMFLVLAIKSAQQKNLNLDSLRSWDWPTIRLPLLYMLGAGLFLGMYLATWLGALLFVFIILCYFLFQFINNHLRGKPIDHLALIGLISFLIATVIFLPRATSRDLILAMWLAVLVPPVLWCISRLMYRFNLKTFIYPLTLVGLAAVILLIVHAVVPDMYGALWAKFKFVFFPSGSTATTTQEMQPFLMPQGIFTTLNAWGNFATSFFLIRGWPIPGTALISFALLLFLFVRGKTENQPWYVPVTWVAVILTMLMALLVILTFQDYRGYAILPMLVFAYLFLRQKSDNDHWLLFFIWSLVIFIATMVQRRFAYYLAINMALLSGYLSWEFISLAQKYRKTMLTEKDQHLTEAAQRVDHYKILGINKNASYREIKGAFRKFTAEYQRIKNPAPEQVQKLKEISNAHEILSNPAKRQDYDSAVSKLTEKEKRRKKQQKKRGIEAYQILTAVLVIIVFFSVYYNNVDHAWDSAGNVPFAPSDGWQQALTWMKDNTPEPLGDPEAYYDLYNSESFQYPEAAYGVTSWWDYGYWISGIAHRIPSANPSQEAAPIQKIAHLFLSENEVDAHEWMQDLKSSYVVIDNDTTVSKFWAIGNWAGEPEDKYVNIYYVPYQGSVIPVPLYEPAYYQTLSVRLYNFDGKAVSSGNTTVITYETISDDDGTSYRYISDAKTYSSYQEAAASISSNSTSTQKIVGTSPFTSPVAIDAVQDYTLVYSSPSGTTYQNTGFIPQVKIFQYTPGP